MNTRNYLLFALPLILALVLVPTMQGSAKTVLQGQAQQALARARVGLGKHVVHVPLDGRAVDVEGSTDLCVAATFEHELEDRLLARGQLVTTRETGHGPAQALRAVALVELAQHAVAEGLEHGADTAGVIVVSDANVDFGGGRGGVGVGGHGVRLQCPSKMGA